MKKKTRTVVYDNEIRIEAYGFHGIMQPFPNHFHEHYVIGFVEDGQRVLSCKNKQYVIERGSVVIFNPGDNHACAQSDGGSFDYRGLNISKNVMADLAEEVTGKRELPGFVENVIRDDEVTCHLRPLHDMAINGVSDLGKEESLLFLISALIHITPYRYLETIRINEAKKMPGKGVQPAEAAVQAGFSDQSHFTNYFVSIIGLTPGVYRDIFFDRKGRREETGKMLTLAE